MENQLRVKKNLGTNFSHPHHRKVFGEAVESGDVQKVKEITHGLKGATGNISATQMHQNCIEMDALAKDGDLSSFPDRLSRLDEQEFWFLKYV